MSESPNIIKAKVRWYSPQKGFGFVYHPDYDEDIFIHFSTLDKTQYKYLYPEDGVICEIGKGKKGLQVLNILEIEQNKQFVIPNNKKYASGHVEEMEGIVRWFNPVKGFGFVEVPGSDQDVFLHISVLRQLQLETISQGVKLKMKVWVSPQGKEAREVMMV